MNKLNRILVVDDNPGDLQIYSELLRTQPYEIWEAATGKEALQAVREKRPDLVLMDVGLPDLSGINICRQIKADPVLKDVFVILFSGDAIGPGSLVGGLDTGADDYIVKGVDIREFLARIRTTLRLQEAAKALRSSEERFRQFAEHIREVFWMTDAEKNKMLYVSPAYEAIWGRSCNSLYESPGNWLESIHPADRKRVAEAAAMNQISGDYDEEYRILTPDGSLRWIKDRAFPIRDEVGEVYRLVGIAEDITKRKRAEEALKESEARQSAIMEAALDGIISFDHAGQIIELNSAAEKMFGCGRGMAMGKNICEVLIPASLRGWFRLGLAQSFAVDEGPILGGQIEMSALRADGEEFPVECALTRIELVGTPIYTAFIRDIRKRRRAEAQVSMLAHAVESTAEPICITDLQDRFTFVNRAFQKTYGYSEKEILGKTPEILFSPNNSPLKMAEILHQSRFGGWRGEVLDRKKDGTEFPVFLSTSQIKDRAGQVIGLLGVAQDITERKRAEEQIQLLANAVQSAGLLISITDDKNRFTFVNRTFTETTGYTQDEALGKTPHFLYSPKSAAGLCEEVYQQTLTGSWRGEILNLRKDGSEFPITLTTSRITDGQGRLLGLVGVAKDISELKQAEKQQAALSQMAYRLSATIAPLDAAHIILDIAADLFGWDAGYVDLYSQKEEKIICVLTIDSVDGQRKRIPAEDQANTPTPLMRMIMEEGGRLINRSDPTQLPVKMEPFGNTRRRSESMLYVPIRHGGTALGVLSIQSYRRSAYSEEDLKLLQTIADHCGDTLQRIRVTEALREAEANYRSIFVNATEGIFRTTPEGRILDANPALAKIFGYRSPAEFMASVTNVAQQAYVVVERRTELKKLLEDHGYAHGFEAENRRKDGSKIWITLNAHVMRGSDGQVQYYEGTIQDITERKQTQQHLAEALELNRTILDSSSLGILAYRATGECVFANEAAGRIFHAKVEKLLQQNFRQMDFWNESGLLKVAEATLHTRKVHTTEAQWVTGSGKQLWLDCRLASFVSRGELHLLSLTDDITDRKQAEEEMRRLPQRIIEAQEAERLRVARDLHDGVNQLIAAAKVRLRKVQDSIAASSPAIGEILSRCSGLLVQALEENRRVAHNLRPSDLDEFGLIVACRNFCKQFRSRTNIKVRCRVSGFESRLPEAVELNLFRIVQETFNNIEKHARAKNVTMGISVKDNCLVLQIRDDGRGFNPGGLRRQRKRCGIGLTNIRERAVSAGGTSTVHSIPDKGTVVIVRVPFVTAQ